MPSPQAARPQALLQVSSSSSLPSSQASPGSTTPSPQTGPTTQVLLHSSSSSSLPSSQASPGPTWPSPQTARVQSSLQAASSPLAAPSSHSSPGSSWPSPQGASGLVIWIETSTPPSQPVANMCSAVASAHVYARRTSRYFVFSICLLLRSIGWTRATHARGRQARRERGCRHDRVGHGSEPGPVAMHSPGDIRRGSTPGGEHLNFEPCEFGPQSRTAERSESRGTCGADREDPRIDAASGRGGADGRRSRPHNNKDFRSARRKSALRRRFRRLLSFSDGRRCGVGSRSDEIAGRARGRTGGTTLPAAGRPGRRRRSPHSRSSLHRRPAGRGLCRLRDAPERRHHRRRSRPQAARAPLPLSPAPALDWGGRLRSRSGSCSATSGSG